MPKLLSKLENAIILALAEGPLQTKDLVKTVMEEHGTVYRRCKRFEERFGLLTSDLKKSDKLLFFFPVTHEVVTKENYDRIKKEIDEADDPDVGLRPFRPNIRVWRLTTVGSQYLHGDATILPPPPPLLKRTSRELNGDVTTPPPKKSKKKKKTKSRGA